MSIMLPDDNKNDLQPFVAHDDFIQRITHAVPDNAAVLLRDVTKKDHASRLQLFVDWLDTNGYHWTRPHLKHYITYLQSDARVVSLKTRRTGGALSPASAKAHIATIAGRYDALLVDPVVSDMLDMLADRLYPLLPVTDRQILVQKMRDRLRLELDPKNRAVAGDVVERDQLDTKYHRLTREQGNKLMAQPRIDTLRGIRDTAMIALMLATGIREQELVRLTVKDLKAVSGSELGLWIERSKGKKKTSRFVPYGDMEDVLMLVELWLQHAGIADEFVFRGWYDRHYKTLRPTPLQTRQVQNILKRYPIRVNGEDVTVKPHDLRRTYARRMWEDGVPVEVIQENLGHANVETTRGYIGEIDMTTRRTRAIFDLPYAVNELQSKMLSTD